MKLLLLNLLFVVNLSACLTTKTVQPQKTVVMQPENKNDTDTVIIEAILHMEDEAKDGFKIGEYIVTLPTSVITSCDGKKIKIKGVVTVHEEKAEKYETTADNKIVHQQVRVGTYKVLNPIEVYVFENNSWLRVYNKNASQ